MFNKSILLAIDGSSQARQAAELCWQIAKTLPARVTAQHVVDSLGLWQFLSYDLPGFIGSGPFFAAHEVMKKQLNSIGETLLDVYQTHATSQGVAGDIFLDEGNTIREVCRRALDHDLVVIGHRPTGIQSPKEDRRRFPRNSVAERLTFYCERPLLVVQGKCEPWSSITLVVSSERSFPASIQGAFEMASFLSVPLNIYCWLESDRQRNCSESISEDILEAKSSFVDVMVKVSAVNGPVSWWIPKVEFDKNSLVIVPTISTDNSREVPFGTPPNLLIRYCALPALLFWPEEYRLSLRESITGSVAAA